MISWFQLFCWSRPDCDAARICGRRSGNVIRHLDIFNVNAPEADEIILRKMCRTCIGYCPEFELYKSTNELFTSRTKTKTGRKIKNIMRHRGNFLNLSYISSTRILISRGLNYTKKFACHSETALNTISLLQRLLVVCKQEQSSYRRSSRWVGDIGHGLVNFKLSELKLSLPLSPSYRRNRPYLSGKYSLHLLQTEENTSEKGRKRFKLFDPSSLIVTLVSFHSTHDHMIIRFKCLKIAG